MRRIVSGEDLRAGCGEPGGFRIELPVGAGDRDAAFKQNGGERRHPRSADADEMDAGKFHEPLSLPPGTAVPDMCTQSILN